MTMNPAIEVSDDGDLTVGRRVHMLMWDRKITQAALGATLGMDQSSFSKRLRGDRGWSVDQLRATAAALTTTVAYLVGETDDPKCTPRDLNPEPTDSGLTATITPIRRRRAA